MKPLFKKLAQNDNDTAGDSRPVSSLLAAPTGGGPIRKPHSQPCSEKTYILRNRVLCLTRFCGAQVISLALSFGVNNLSFFFCLFYQPLCFHRVVGSSPGTEVCTPQKTFPCISFPQWKWLGCTRCVRSDAAGLSVGN